MLRRTGFKRQQIGWQRKPKPALSSRKKQAKAERRTRKAEKDRKRRAEQYGCEYGQWLREQRAAMGCPLCGRRHGGGRTVLHHVTRRSQLGKAEDQIFTCQDCHDEGHKSGFAELEAAAGVDLAQLAATYAGHGYTLGLLPVEKCDTCGAWHSQRYMVTVETEGRTYRACTTKCEPSRLP